MSTAPSCRRIRCFSILIAAAIPAAAIGAPGTPPAPDAQPARGALLGDLARDIARCETVLQRHRDGAAAATIAVVSPDDPGILRRAENTLRLAALLESRWHETLDSARLQREFDRMRRDSQRPAWLDELLWALDRDGARVARALVAPDLVTRLAWQHFRSEGVDTTDFSEFVRISAPPADTAARRASQWRVDVAPPDSRGASLGNDAPTAGWRSGGLMTDSGRDGDGGWTGSQYIFWNGVAPWIYTYATDSWRMGTTVGRPPRTTGPSVGWAGDRLFVWGGLDADRQLNFVTAGALYDPVADAWTPISTQNAPQSDGTPVVWTGTSVIGMGGRYPQKGTDSHCTCTIFTVTSNTFFMYTPSTNSWATNLPSGPSGGDSRPIAWTGSEVLVWGGNSESASFCGPFFPSMLIGTGAAFNPTTMSWRTISPSGAPSARRDHMGAWTGTEWMIWGGNAFGSGFYDGALYNPATDSWRPVSTSGAPQIAGGSLVWTGSQALLRGNDAVNGPESGARYDPVTNTWTSLARPPFATGGRAAWTGTTALYLATTHGGRYSPATDSWTEVLSPGTGPVSRRAGGAAVYTGAELLVWGGQTWDQSAISTGDRFSLATGAWTPMSTDGAPPGIVTPNSAWTGDAMLVQYGAQGGRYYPATDSWLPMSSAGAPSANLAVWTGTEFIVWNGGGARYRPAVDQWFPMASAGAPSSAEFLLWTGSRVLTWSRGSHCPPFNPAIADVGALYDPFTDHWFANAPANEYRKSAEGIWAGHEAVLLGGYFDAYNNNICERGFEESTVDLFTPASNAWAFPPVTTAKGVGAVDVWDGGGVIREGGFLEEVYFRQSFPIYSRCTYTIDVPDHQRLDLFTDQVANENSPSPVPHSSNRRAFWTGQDVLHFDFQWGLGAFFSPGLDPNADADGDGAPRSIDCDDADPTTHPGALDVCDFHDNDCDGTVDEDGKVDADGDGHFSCVDDCNDSNTAVYNGAPELCDGLDNNCNGLIDDGAGTDADSDGYNNCTAPRDCNDNNNTVYPGAPELCDSLDNDCDGSIDEGAGVDNDGDGHTTCNDDCNDSLATVWRKPTFFTSLKLSGKTATVISWDDMKPAWGTSSVYDVVRGKMTQLRAAKNFSQATCLGNNRGTNSVIDSTTVPVGDSFYYLTRGQNSCGTGTYGTALSDSTAVACP